MALIQNVETVYGVSLKEAYHRQLSVLFDYETMTKTTRMGIYCDKLSRDTGKPPIYVRKIVVPIDEKAYPVRAKDYAEQKLTPNYSESTDT